MQSGGWANQSPTARERRGQRSVSIRLLVASESSDSLAIGSTPNGYGQALASGKVPEFPLDGVGPLLSACC